jgi:cysteine-rich repeat protein
VDADCLGLDALCLGDNKRIQPVDNPLGSEPEGGQRQLSRGVCSGPVPDTCLSDADCNGGATCDPVLIYAADADADGDGIFDTVDNCDGVPNETQFDLDADGIGDVCDREVCGNGSQEYGEGCDDGNRTSGDGCDASCQLEGPLAACENGLDDDGDGLVDADDGGCENASDPSERRPDVACDDGLDNDGDYGVDVGGDAGCASADSQLEEPQCSNGIDDDGDGYADWNGADLGDPDQHCASPKDNREAAGRACGLGAELLITVALLWGLARRRRLGCHDRGEFVV